jgi:hypothetical protein
LVVEPAGDVADGAAAGDVVVEDAPDHGGLFLVDDEVGGAVPSAGDSHVAVRGPPVHRLAGSGPEQLAPPGSFGDLGPFVFGDHGLDLGEEAGLGVGGDVGGVEVADAHPVAGEFVGDEHLVGVGTGQAVGGQAPQRLDEAALGGVAEGVEPGPVQASAGAAIVDVLVDQLVALGCHPGAQRLELGADGASGFLGVG